VKALITGSQGFVGRHFSRYLRKEGWQTTELDIKSAQDVRPYFRTSPTSFDLVVHCAAVVGGRTTIDGAPLALASNLEIDAAMFQWACRVRPTRIIYFSSSAAYPVDYQRVGRNSVLTEIDIEVDNPRRSGTWLPDQLYGWAKLTGEVLAQRALGEGLGVTVVRPFSGYGEDQDADYPFPAFIDRALQREDPFRIWGDGKQVRDFIHIDDIVEATMALVEVEENGPVNLGTGIPTSMHSLAQQVCQASGYEPAFEYVKSAPSGVAWRVADVRYMRQFYKHRTTLGEGIQKALYFRRMIAGVRANL
jgi:nucleoside-diphosphate-sugar epimerase